jgi:hypothetical protein
MSRRYGSALCHGNIVAYAAVSVREEGEVRESM